MPKPPASDRTDFYDHAPCGFHALDENGVMVDVNETELELLQRSRDEVIGKCRFLEFLAPRSKQRFVREFPTFKRSGRIEGLPFDLVRKDGSTVPVLLSATALFDENGRFVRSRSVIVRDPRRGLPEDSVREAYDTLQEKLDDEKQQLETAIAALRDEIDERERAEALLRLSEERALAVIDAVIDGVITCDDGGFVETMNPAAERIFGWRESELSGRSALLLLAAPYAQRYREFLARPRAEDGLIGTKREIDGLRRDGSVFPIEVAFSEMRLGSRLLLIATVRDLSDKRRAEAELERLQAEVRRNEVMAMIGSLVAGFAHEARNPLFGISAVLDALAVRLGETTEYAEHLALVRRDVKRLNDLMQDLLEFGRPSEQIDLARRPIATVLADAVAECTTLCRACDVAIEAQLDDDGAIVVANDRLVRGFQNLLQNAIQFSPRGAVVTLASACEEPGVVTCTVRDRGPGLAEADLPRLFEPFYTRRRGGTGLGLAIVQRIVEEHRGSVGAANHRDGGAVLSVRLPVSAA
ncbi:PAS domain S-box protein [Candidatus Binatia bacterium]|nr:PAS domain S-box protein [Candidatus Binatia bacterium]